MVDRRCLFYLLHGSAVIKQSVNRQANKLSSNKSKAKLKHLSDSLMQATTPRLYSKCLDQVKDFISEKPHKRNFLATWLDWWHNRLFHVYRAFRSSDIR